MAEEKGESIIPWPAVGTLIVILTGGYLSHEPLTSARPKVDPRLTSQNLNEQDIQARLWQDPVAAAETDASHPGGDHKISFLLNEILQRSSQKALVMPVMVPGG